VTRRDDPRRLCFLERQLLIVFCFIQEWVPKYALASQS